MPNLREAVANVIMDGTQRHYNGLEGEGLYGGVLIDRYVGGARKRKTPRKKKAGGVMIDRYVGCGVKKMAPRKRAIGGARSNYMGFVKMWHAHNPQYTWQEAVRMASADYHKAAHSAANKMGLGVMAAGSKRKRRAGVMAAGARSKRVPKRKATVRQRRAGVMAAGVMAAGARKRNYGSKARR